MATITQARTLLLLAMVEHPDRAKAYAAIGSDEAKLQQFAEELGEVDLPELPEDGADDEADTSESLDFAALTEGFTGTKKDSKGREYHYQDGKRVAKVKDEATGEERMVPLATYERTPEVASQVRQNYLAGLGQLASGAWKPQDVLDDVEMRREQSHTANQKNHAQRYKTLADQFEQRYGAEAMTSPEWQAVKAAFRGARDNAGAHLDFMADEIEAAAKAHAAGAPAAIADAQRYLGEYEAKMATDAHRDFEKIAAAVMAFRAKHGSK